MLIEWKIWWTVNDAWGLRTVYYKEMGNNIINNLVKDFRKIV